MRSQDEIVRAMRALQEADRPIEAEYGVLLCCLDWPHAREFLKPEATEDQWVGPGELTITEEEITADADRFFRGVWDAITDHNRIHAEKRLGNARAYVWLLTDDDHAAAFDARDDRPFGGPKLLWASGILRMPSPDSTRAARMAMGQPCWDGCTEGCRG